MERGSPLTKWEFTELIAGFTGTNRVEAADGVIEVWTSKRRSLEAWLKVTTPPEGIERVVVHSGRKKLA